MRAATKKIAASAMEKAMAGQGMAWVKRGEPLPMARTMSMEAGSQALGTR